MPMPLPFVDRSSSALPVQFVPQPKWRSWLKEQSAARRGWLESLGIRGAAGDFAVLPGRDGKAAGAVLVLQAAIPITMRHTTLAIPAILRHVAKVCPNT